MSHNRHRRRYYSAAGDRLGWSIVSMGERTTFMLACVILSTVVAANDAPWLPFCPHLCRCDARHGVLSHQVRHVTDCTNAGITETLPVNISLETQALVLRNNHLTVEHLVSLERFPNLTEADLSANRLYDLEDLEFDLGTLRYVAFDQNDIDYIPKRSFLTMPDLVYLSVANNKIEIMHPDCFLGLRGLKTLDLSSNRIFTLDPQWFRSLSTLETLDLHENNIHALHDEEMKRLYRLKHLDLKNNQLKHIYDGAFQGLFKLETLDLSRNFLNFVPTNALKRLPKLDSIDIGENSIHRLVAGSWEGITVSVLKMSATNGLRIVDKGAFVNLPRLADLQLSENKQLLYIDRESFEQLPKLRSLQLHKNNLTSVEEGLISGLPSLSSLTVHGNKFVCDCAVKWLVKELTEHTRNLSISDVDQIRCVAPSALKGKQLDCKEAQNIPSTCPPRILDLFPESLDTVLGGEFHLDCRIVGSPPPQMEWQLPAHRRDNDVDDDVLLLKSGSHDAKGGHVDVDDAGTLRVDYVEYLDHGVYTCAASNPRGRDERTAHVQVTNMRASLLILQITSSSVTVTWRSTRYPNQYQILYHLSNINNNTYQKADIRPYMRSYTANDLLPRTAYEFCLAIKHDKHVAKINCTIIRTHSVSHGQPGVFNARNYIIGGSVSCFIVVLVSACTLTYFVQKYNRRKKQQEELYSDNLSQLFLASMDSMSDTTPITYENRGAEMFDDDDLEEIRSTASMASCSTAAHA